MELGLYCGLTQLQGRADSRVPAVSPSLGIYWADAWMNGCVNGADSPQPRGVCSYARGCNPAWREGPLEWPAVTQGVGGTSSGPWTDLHGTRQILGLGHPGTRWLGALASAMDRGVAWPQREGCRPARIHPGRCHSPNASLLRAQGSGGCRQERLPSDGVSEQGLRPTRDTGGGGGNSG